MRVFTSVLALCMLFLGFPFTAAEAENHVIIADNLQAISEIAQKKQLPVMMFFAAEDCEFCDALESDYLSAMSRASEYDKKIIIRKVMIDSYEDVSDFSGENISAEAFSDKFNVRVTPTLLFVDHQGEELTKKIVGYNRSGFFGAYLDEAIDAAKQKIMSN